MNECVCCGATVPEGRQVCLICEKGKKAKEVDLAIEECLEEMP